jgi:L-ascorbate metabolism protein UlaG (beta-lactamase superfamily)
MGGKTEGGEHGGGSEDRAEGIGSVSRMSPVWGQRRKGVPIVIEPFLSDDAFLLDVEAMRDKPGLHVWWLGQSGFLFMHQGHAALIDPYLSESLTEKYANTDKPHERMSRRVIDPARLDFISAAASTHNHTDHLDARTLKPIMDMSTDVAVIVGAANRAFAADRLGVDELELLTADDGETVQVGEFSFTGVPAAHETVERDAAGHCRYLGYILRAGAWAVYHSGDTVLYDGLVERVRPYEVDLALLPINGRAPERRVAGNLTGPEAARLAQDIGAGLVIPCHYDMFAFNTASPEPFMDECNRLGQPYRVLQLGERWSGISR